MQQNRKIEIIFNEDGTVFIPWWYSEIKEVICALCGCKGTPKCEEKRQNLRYGSCPNNNPYCG
jgi:hypothetical protein